MPSPSAQPALTVLCIDDQEDGLAVRKIFLETFGYHVLTASSGPEGLRYAGENRIDAVLLDYRMPEMDGAEVARIFRERYPALPILILTGFPGELPAALSSLVEGVITKGSAPTAVLEHLQRVLGRKPEKPSAQLDGRHVAERVADTRKQVQRSRERTAPPRMRRKS